MRPIKKESRSQEYNPYQTAKRDLFEAIGPYCSYCERNIELGGAVEHVQPKSKISKKKYSWDNFLLGCTNCNSTKGNKTIDDTNINDYVWPDIDDTYHMIQYDPTTLIPSPAPDLSDEDKEKVRRLIELTGLDRPSPKEGSLDYNKASDTRVEKRKEIAREAKEYKSQYLELPDDIKPVFAISLLTLIKHSGLWSIWYHEFEDVPELKEPLLNLIPGTRKEFF